MGELQNAVVHEHTQTYLQTSQSSRHGGSVPPCENHADTCKLAGAGNSARRSGPRGTLFGRLSREATQPPQPCSTPALCRAPSRNAPGRSPALPPDSLRMQRLGHYLAGKTIFSINVLACKRMLLGLWSHHSP